MVAFILRLLRNLALRVQIGNPVHKAPLLVTEPPEEGGKLLNFGNARPVSVWQLHNITCSGLYGGVIINSQNKMYSRFISFPWGKDLHPALCLPYLGKRIATLTKAAFLLTPDASGNYYHWIMDLLPRLLLIKKCGLTDFDQRHIILHWPPKSYELNTLTLLGIPKERVLRIKAFQTINVKDLVIADLVKQGKQFPVWKKQLLDEFKEKVLGNFIYGAPKKLYLLRGKQSKRCLVGEEQLVRLLKELGFYILDPQQMTVLEQIKALANAKMVIGLHGAALTNIIFCREDTLVIELRSTCQPPEHFSEIAKTCKLHFEVVSLNPQKVSENYHTANQQNLVLGDDNIKSLKAKLRAYDKKSSGNYRNAASPLKF